MDKPVAVIDDDPGVLDSVKILLETKGMPVTCYSSAIEFLSSSTEASCVVSDVRMPGMSGLELLGKIKKRGDDCPVILLTGHGDIEMAVQAIKDGAADFIEKPFDTERLVDSVRHAVSQIEKHSIEKDVLQSWRTNYASLSERQKETMAALIQGLSNKEIAGRLGISPRTVEIHRAWVMNKMGAKTLAELVRMGLELGV